MTQDTFSVIFLEYRIKKYEHFLKVTFHGFAAHLKDYFSARVMRGISSTNLENKEVSVQAKLKIDLSKLRH